MESLNTFYENECVIEKHKPQDKVGLKNIYHRDAYRIGIFFEKNFTINATLKRLKAVFSNILKCWNIVKSAKSFVYMLVGGNGRRTLKPTVQYNNH